jgi:propionyl-CoA synthetase
MRPIRRFGSGLSVGRTNLCYNAVDRHLAARGDQRALIAVSTETDTTDEWTYRQLYQAVNTFAATLQSLGVVEGDRVVIYMPNTGRSRDRDAGLCARIGAIHSVVFGGFAAHNLALRIDDAQPSLLICADAGMRSGKVIRVQAVGGRGAGAKRSRRRRRVLVVHRGLDAADMPVTEGRDVDYAAGR